MVEISRKPEKSTLFALHLKPLLKVELSRKAERRLSERTDDAIRRSPEIPLVDSMARGILVG